MTSLDTPWIPPSWTSSWIPLLEASQTPSQDPLPGPPKKGQKWGFPGGARKWPKSGIFPPPRKCAKFPPRGRPPREARFWGLREGVQKGGFSGASIEQNTRKRGCSGGWRILSQSWVAEFCPKKCRILSRLGELLNTQRNVHFLASRPAPAGPARGRSWGGYPGLPGGAPGHPLPGLRIGGYRGVSWEGGVPIVGLPVVARLPGSYCMISAVALTRCRSSRCCTPTMMLRW